MPPSKTIAKTTAKTGTKPAAKPPLVKAAPPKAAPKIKEMPVAAAAPEPAAEATPEAMAKLQRARDRWRTRVEELERGAKAKAEETLRLKAQQDKQQARLQV